MIKIKKYKALAWHKQALGGLFGDSKSRFENSWIIDVKVFGILVYRSITQM